MNGTNIEAGTGQPTINYRERIPPQTERVKRLLAGYAEQPSPELELRLKREADLLFHYVNAAKGDTRERAKAAAERARQAALSKVIVGSPSK